MRTRLTRAVVAAFMLAGCSDGTSPNDELTAARHRWESWGPASYDLVLQRGACECTSAALRAMVVVVRDGAVQSKFYLDTGEPIVDPSGTYAPDVPGLFNLISGALTDGHTVEARYDAITGLPREIVIDREAIPVDGGYSLTVELRSPATARRSRPG